eukprot:3742667-Alexandrium_andersonii.AAC.1
MHAKHLAEATLGVTAGQVARSCLRRSLRTHKMEAKHSEFVRRVHAMDSWESLGPLRYGSMALLELRQAKQDGV